MESKISGLIIIDKPKDISSAGVVRFVKKTLKVDKVGHAGTLDPFAEGVLICCLNQATRIAGFMLNGEKKYAAILKLGEETNTQDFTGTIVSTGEPHDFPPHAIQDAFNNFIGPIEQLPPVYSALKHKGVPLYKLARCGKPIQKPPRRVRIFNITINKIALPFVYFEVTCSAGTYIRTLCADVGKYLGCGGHLAALKRIESSGFTLDQAISLPEIEKLKDSVKLSKQIINMADALPGMPQFKAGKQLVEKVRHGRTISARDLDSANGVGSTYIPGSDIKIIDQVGNLIAILNYSKVGHRLKYRCVFPQQRSQ